jgi:hypothetical protein
MNTCYNCLDRHVERGFGSQTAIIHDSPVTRTIRKISYKELLSEVKVVVKAHDRQNKRIENKAVQEWLEKNTTLRWPTSKLIDGCPWQSKKHIATRLKLFKNACAVMIIVARFVRPASGLIETL